MHGRQNLTDGGSRSGEKVRLYEVAKEVGLPNKELVDRVRSMGIDVKNHMSSLDMDDVQRIKRALDKERVENREVKRISATVIRRRSKAAPAVATPQPQTGPTSSTFPVDAPQRTREPRRDEPQGHFQTADAGRRFDADAKGQDADVLQPNSAQAESYAHADGDFALHEEQPALDSDGAAANVSDDQGDDFGGAADSGSDIASAVEDLGESPDARATAAEPASSDARGGKTVPAAAAAADSGEVATPARATAGDAAKPTPPIDFDKLPINSPLRRKEQPKREIRFAPGFKPPAQRVVRPAPVQATEAQPLSAADALKMLAPAAPRRRPPQQVVITDLDRRGATPAGPGGVRQPQMPQDRRFKGQQRRKKKQAVGKKGKKTEITTPAEHKRVIRVEDTITVSDIAHQMGVKSTQVLRKLWAMGMTNIMITHSIDADAASLLASEFGYEVEDVTFNEADVLFEQDSAPEDLEPRAPVITVMGHVDHGKTSLLDAIRGSNVARGEAGGITQHMGAYRVATARGDVVFLDTPGHAAFTQMRARGAQATDVVVLVVAADDGVMPQTLEAIDHARDAGVPIVVALNKIDRADANPDRVMNGLAERGLVPEDWGGDTLFCRVSALTKVGIEELLEKLVLQAELLELQANPKKRAKGTVVEARMDRARGAMSTVLVQEGTLRVGDTVVCGEHMGKVRAMLDDRGNAVEEAGPSTPVEVLGIGGVPCAGDVLNAVADDKDAKVLAEHRRNQTRRSELGKASAKTIEDILGELQSGDSRELKLLVKADVQGSSEAIRESLAKLSTERVQVNVISTGVGGIHEADVNLAKAAGGLIVGFNVRTAGKASQLAEREGVEIRTYDVIYELLDEVKSLMRGLLPKDRTEKQIGRAEVRQTFTIPKIGMIAGCSVLDGKITRNSHLRLIRDSVKIYDGKVSSLRRFKDDVREVAQGYECGIGIDGYQQLQVADIIEAYDIEEVMPDL